MKKPNQDDEPFFITEEIAAEMPAVARHCQPVPVTPRSSLRDRVDRHPP